MQPLAAVFKIVLISTITSRMLYFFNLLSWPRISFRGFHLVIYHFTSSYTADQGVNTRFCSTSKYSFQLYWWRLKSVDPASHSYYWIITPSILGTHIFSSIMRIVMRLLVLDIISQLDIVYQNPQHVRKAYLFPLLQHMSNWLPCFWGELIVFYIVLILPVSFFMRQSLLCSINSESKFCSD